MTQKIAYFIWTVEGTEFYGDECWGQAWKNAYAFAKANRLPMWRLKVTEDLDGNILKEENFFLAKGKVFLNERFYAPEKVYLFND